MLSLASGAMALSLDGVAIPDERIVEGTPLRLNGAGVRTATVFDIHVYVAGLFLEEPSRDAEAILGSRRPRLLELHFVHDLSAPRVRQAWVEAFARTCPEPCRLPQPVVRQFLDAVPDMHKGDVARFFFSANTLRVAVNGRELGVIHDPEFERTVLATFLGPAPASPRLKLDLLGVK